MSLNVHCTNGNSAPPLLTGGYIDVYIIFKYTVILMRKKNKSVIVFFFQKECCLLDFVHINRLMGNLCKSKYTDNHGIILCVSAHQQTNGSMTRRNTYVCERTSTDRYPAIPNGKDSRLDNPRIILSISVYLFIYLFLLF